MRATDALVAGIRRQLRRDTPSLVDFALEMMRIPTENPPGAAYARCARLIASRLRELGLSTRVVDPTGSGPSVVGTFGDGKRALYFSGHYDVVPAQAYGPGLLSVSHGPSEFVSVPRLVECAEVYARAAVRLLS